MGWGVYKPVSVAHPGVHPPKPKWDGDMELGKSGSCDSAPLAHDVGTPVRGKKGAQKESWGLLVFNAGF